MARHWHAYRVRTLALFVVLSVHVSERTDFDSQAVTFLNKVKLYRLSQFLLRINELYVLIRHSQNERQVGRFLWGIKVKCVKEFELNSVWRPAVVCQCWGCLDQVWDNRWGGKGTAPAVTNIWKFSGKITQHIRNHSWKCKFISRILLTDAVSSATK
jgi:hypothetical protein